MKDLVVLVPDKNTKFVLEGLLSRTESFQIKHIEYDIYYIHPEHDPGIYHKGADFLRFQRKFYNYALVFLDREGCGPEHKTAEEIASEIKSHLEKNGWPNHAEVIVFDPELEIWAWINSPNMSKNLGWQFFEELKNFLQDKKLWHKNALKPHRPKEAFEFALYEKRIQRSSAIYKKIAQSVSLRTCNEPSFLQFKKILLNWFAKENYNMGTS